MVAKYCVFGNVFLFIPQRNKMLVAILVLTWIKICDKMEL